MITADEATAPPTTVSIKVNFFGVLDFEVENLFVLQRHPEIRLRVWACKERYSTRPVRWEGEAGWPDDKFLFSTDCSGDADAIVGIQNNDTGKYLAVRRILLHELFDAETIVFDMVGGRMALSTQSETLPPPQQPRRIVIAVPADQTLEDLRTAFETERVPIRGWQAVTVAKGDYVRVSIEDQICERERCFGPDGDGGFFTNHKVVTQLGDGAVLKGRKEGTFIARETASLFIFVDDAGPALTGAYKAVIDVNLPGSRTAVSVAAVGVASAPSRVRARDDKNLPN